MPHARKDYQPRGQNFALAFKCRYDHPKQRNAYDEEDERRGDIHKYAKNFRFHHTPQSSLDFSERITRNTIMLTIAIGIMMSTAAAIVSDCVAALSR